MASTIPSNVQSKPTKKKGWLPFRRHKTPKDKDSRKSAPAEQPLHLNNVTPTPKSPTSNGPLNAPATVYQPDESNSNNRDNQGDKSEFTGPPVFRGTASIIFIQFSLFLSEFAGFIAILK